MVQNSRVVYDSNDPNVKIKNTSQSRKSVVLTFDDGPSKILPDILDVLAEEKVPAVFFWETRLLYPSRPWKRVMQEGHIIGTHNSRHVNMANLSYEEQYTALDGSVRKLESITNTNISFFRPPFGQYNENTLLAANQLGLIPVLWRIGSFDWELKNNPEKIIENVTDNLEDGAIILLHELKQTLSVLPELIREIKRQGYAFTLLDSEIDA